MAVFSGTVFTITDGVNTSRIGLQSARFEVPANRPWKSSNRTVEGRWTQNVHDSKRLKIPLSGYWQTTYLYLVGNMLHLLNQEGMPVLILNMDGNRNQQGRGIRYTGRGTGDRVCGFSDIPDYAWGNIWYGVGFKAGGQLMVAGYERTAAYLWNFAGKEPGYIILDGTRLGPGLGASAGIVAVLGFNFPQLVSAVGNTSAQMDFALAVGNKWSGLLKGMPGALRGLTELQDLERVVDSVAHLAKVAKRLEKTEAMANWAKVLVNFSGVDPSSAGLSVIDIPTPWTSGGLEVTVCYTWSVVSEANGVQALSSRTGPGARGILPEPGPNWRTPSINFKKPGEM